MVFMQIAFLKFVKTITVFSHGFRKIKKNHSREGILVHS